MTQEEVQALQEQNKQQQAQIEQLKQQIQAIAQTQKETVNNRWHWGKWWANTFAGFIFGKDAKQSFEQIGKEIKEQKIPNPETLTVAGYHVLWRFVRVTAFGWVATIFTIIFIGLEIWLFWKQTDLMEKQNKMFSKQNELVTGQNKLVTQQNLLSEASRRSSLVLLMSNIEDRVAEELKEPDNKSKKLSDALIGRIVALCNSLKPYQYLIMSDSLSKSIGPERGQMLISLINADLDTLTYQKIYKNANFEGADLQNANLSFKYLKWANLSKANLSKANLSGANLSKANLSGANLVEADLVGANLSKANLGGAKLNSANFGEADLSVADLSVADLDRADLLKANLTGANLSGADLRGANLFGVNLFGAKLNEAKLDRLDIFKGTRNFPEEYEIDATPEKENGKTFYHIRRKKK